MNTSFRVDQPVGLSYTTDRQLDNVDVVVLAGTIGDEAPWLCGLPRWALPLPGTTIIEALLNGFSKAFTGTYTVCANGQTPWIKDFTTGSHPRTAVLGFFSDEIPRGPAGCLKACQPRLREGTVFVVGGSVWLEEDPRWMADQHRSQRNALTVFCVRESLGTGAAVHTTLRPVGVYACEPVVMDYIQSSGYQDIKEQLIPALKRAGHRVSAVTLRNAAYEVSDWRAYMRVLSHCLVSPGMETLNYRRLAPGVWCGEDVEIGRDVRITGPVLVGHGCRIGEGAIVVGPTILGAGCHVGPGSSIVRVVARDRVRFDAGALVIDRLVP